MDHVITNRTQPTADRCGTILAAAVILSLYGCNKAPTVPDGSSTSSPTTASTGANVVANVSWIAPTHNSDGSKITDLAGYYIYYGTSPNNLNESIQVRDPGTTSYTVKKLKSGTTYYFSVVAYTATGISGGASATVSKAIP
jgi:hypothetical protein